MLYRETWSFCRPFAGGCGSPESLGAFAGVWWVLGGTLVAQRGHLGLCWALPGLGNALLPFRERQGSLWALLRPGQCSAALRRDPEPSPGFALNLQGACCPPESPQGFRQTLAGPCFSPELARSFARHCGHLGRALPPSREPLGFH